MPQRTGAEYERNADAYGVALACTALSTSPSAKTLAADPPVNVLNTLSRLQDELDENYFTMDDPKTNGYITFDSTGTESTLWQVSQGLSKIDMTSLSHWQRTGTPVAFYRSDADSRFPIRMNAGSGSPKTELVDLRVQCTGATCKVAPRSQTREDTFARHGVDGSCWFMARPALKDTLR